MGRPRTLRTTIDRVGDNQLKAFWQLRSTLSNKADHKLVREAIVGRVREIKLRRKLDEAMRNGPCLKNMEYTVCICKACVGGK